MSSSRNIKFLLVDDLDANLVALEGLLRREGLELLKARSGPEALELLLVHEIALAFIDVQMPEMSGFELAEMMRGTDRTRSVPIIFLTAGVVDQERRIKGYETGAVDFLPKPIDPGILRNKAAVFYELARQRQEVRESQEQLREVNERLARGNAELERADRSKNEFLAMLAHELRNPLAPMLTGMEILLKSPGDAATAENIGGMMKRQIDQMAHLIDDLLDVSRITTGKIELQKSSISVAATIAQAVESVQPLIDARKHELVVEPIDPDLQLSADPHRLAQVVSNLLSNAAKYTAPGGRIVLTTSASPDGILRIAVKDNGRGVKAEHQAGIFDLFDQGASGPKDGLGIGLTLVNSLVRMHGGTVSVASEGEGMGSEFSIELPGLQEAAVEKTTKIVPESGTAPAEKLRVLVADDGKSTADILGMFFRMEGMDTAVVYDGGQAVEKAESFQPDLACLDLGMPVINGYEAARRMRELCPDAYIVALSGWGSEDDRRRTAEAGFDEHLVKPVNPSDLRDLMKRVSSRVEIAAT